MADEVFGDRLLVVDDEPAFGLVVKKIAQDVGFEVIVTAEAGAFLEAARGWQPTVVMLDLKMPSTDGVQLLRMLAADQCPAHIMLTSGEDWKVLDTAMQLGRERGLKMSEPLAKPVRASALRERLLAFKRIPKLQLTADLARVVVDGQLFLEYQPKLDCRLGRITGVEALVRWNHPVHGLMLPDQFIPLAEETGLIRDVTDWVVASAAEQAARWHVANLALNVAVNVSAADLDDLGLPDRLERSCRAASIDPALITLELTETGAMRRAVQMMDVLTRCRLKGFKLSIDDFGTGYSSLVQLQRLPFSEIKIDRSFVAEMTRNSGSRVIVEIIVDLARKLGLVCVAEGVEDGAALSALTELRCDLAQGYHLCRPIAPDGVASFISRYESGMDETCNGEAA